uniref:Uncharacterized protein n=1 Tax=Bactrocera dorsalis TaxID=27457 RepID=A0A034WLV6_BACDO
MSTNGEAEFLPKRKRYNPQKRWKVAEEKALIEFLLENRDFEKPSARLFYNRFANEKQILVEWKSARSKVRNMRPTYNKAKEWEGSTGAGCMDGDTIKSVLLKKFRYFYEFDDIFGARLNACAVVEEIMESADTTIEVLSPVQIEIPVVNETVTTPR